jgi:acetyl-CoA carboxylase biotin carboxyl carrier protein
MARKEIASDVSGKVWKIEVQEGAEIGEDESIMIIDSMKMEIPVSSTASGRVIHILVKEGDAVADGQTVAIIDVEGA